jgi:hypothetical protein
MRGPGASYRWGLTGGVGWSAAGGEQLPVGVADEQVFTLGEGEVERGGDVLVGAPIRLGIARPKMRRRKSERIKRMNSIRPCSGQPVGISSAARSVRGLAGVLCSGVRPAA